MKRAFDKQRAWLAFHLLRVVMWLTDGVYCKAVAQSGLIALESRHWRTNTPCQAPSWMSLKKGDVFLFMGGGDNEQQQ